MTDDHTNMLRQMEADAKLTEPEGETMNDNDRDIKISDLRERVNALQEVLSQHISGYNKTVGKMLDANEQFNREVSEHNEIVDTNNELQVEIDGLKKENERLREEVASLGMQFGNLSERYDRRMKNNQALREEVNHVCKRLAEWKLLAKAKMKTIEELQEVLRK